MVSLKLLTTWDVKPHTFELRLEESNRGDSNITRDTPTRTPIMTYFVSNELLETKQLNQLPNEHILF